MSPFMYWFIVVLLCGYGIGATVCVVLFIADVIERIRIWWDSGEWL